MDDMVQIDVRGPEDKLLSSFPNPGEPTAEQIQKIKEKFAKNNDLQPDDIRVGSGVSLQADEPVRILSIFNENGDFVMQNFTREDSVTDELTEKYEAEYGAGATLKITELSDPYSEEIDDTKQADE